MRVHLMIARWLMLALVLLSGAAVAQNGGSLFWEASAGSKTVFLLGTIHVGRPDFYPLPGKVEEAYKASKAIALEADLTDEQAVTTSMQIGVLPEGRALEGELPAELGMQLQRSLAVRGLPAEAFRPLKPFMAMFALVAMEYARLGHVPEYGLDRHFAQRARADGKTLVGLETIEGQMRMMDGLSAPLQQTMLKLTLDDIDSGKMAPMAEQLIAAWRKGDAQAVHGLLDSEERRLPPGLAAEFHEKFLTKRNRTMLAGVEQALNATDMLFVAVGALHLVGPDSLTELLQKKGFTVKRR